MKALRIANEHAMLLPEVQELFVRAFKEEHLADAEEVWNWLRDRITSDQLRVWVSRDDSMQLNGLLIATFEYGPFHPDPFALQFYTEDRKSTDALLEALKVWGLDELGRKRVRFINQTGATDRAMIRHWESKPGVNVVAVEGGLMVGEWEEK